MTSQETFVINHAHEKISPLLLATLIIVLT